MPASRSYTDHEIGRLIDYLERSGELDNTMIFVISDNGASGEGGPNGSVNENKFFNGVMDDMTDNLTYLDGSVRRTRTTTTRSVGRFAFNTPFKLCKRHTVERWRRRPDDGALAGRASRPRARSATSTRTAATSCPPCTTAWISSRRQWSRATRSGSSRAPASSTASTTALRRRRRTSQYYVMLGTRGIWHSGWKAERDARCGARATGATSPRTAGSCTTSRRTGRSATTSPTSTRR